MGIKSLYQDDKVVAFNHKKETNTKKALEILPKISKMFVAYCSRTNKEMFATLPFPVHAEFESDFKNIWLLNAVFLSGVVEGFHLAVKDDLPKISFNVDLLVSTYENTPERTTIRIHDMVLFLNIDKENGVIKSVNKDGMDLGTIAFNEFNKKHNFENGYDFFYSFKAQKLREQMEKAVTMRT